MGARLRRPDRPYHRPLPHVSRRRCMLPQSLEADVTGSTAEFKREMNELDIVETSGTRTSKARCVFPRPDAKLESRGL